MPPRRGGRQQGRVEVPGKIRAVLHAHGLLPGKAAQRILSGNHLAPALEDARRVAIETVLRDGQPFPALLFPSGGVRQLEIGQRITVHLLSPLTLVSMDLPNTKKR